ncbi:MAG: glycosyltransferase family 2 protein [Marinilabiliaceae bacterium]|nr:glycosyltransferase family 2 protein [Marinilabiliaceae bacterium]
MDRLGHTQKDISIIIVSYNARAFLNLCLFAVRKSVPGLSNEIFIVDNASSDGTVEMVREKFPEVTLIANTVNLGFSAANNQAIHQASGKIILLLNPDTIIGEDTLEKIIQFYQEYPQAGAVGVKMIDGSGKYLRESKRGLPTPRTSLYKLTGLTTLFPRSPRFAQYYQGHLNENKLQQPDILPGAFMAFRKQQLQQTHALDESFFMYGEDVDFSYRLQQQADHNYYLGNLPIIHFKGESTPLNSKLVYHFYYSMWIFYHLHFRKKYSLIAAFMVKAGIMMAASLSIITLPLRKIKNHIQQKKSVTYHTIFFCSPSQQITEGLIRKHYPKANNFQYIHPEDLESGYSTLDLNKGMIIFDIAHVQIMQMIKIIERMNLKASFSFLSPDHSFILSSQHSAGKGQIFTF